MARRHSNQMPELANINGQLHKRTLFRVVARKDGLPRDCIMILDNETVEIEEGMEFMTAYIPKVMFEKVTR